MYGLVNKAIQGLVTENYGEETWCQIRKKSGVTEDVFISNQAYSDDTTYALVSAACEVLGVGSEEVLEAFGEYWVLNTAVDGYGELMDAAGDDLIEFLTFLPNFHARIMLIFPDLKPPSFEIDEVTDNSMLLRYFSDRTGLQSFVIGLVQGLGKRFGTPTSCVLESRKSQEVDYDVFRITWTP